MLPFPVRSGRYPRYDGTIAQRWTGARMRKQRLLMGLIALPFPPQWLPAIALGVRKSRDWNISTILGTATGLAISTPKGWELTSAGWHAVEAMIKEAGLSLPAAPPAVSASQPRDAPIREYAANPARVLACDKPRVFIGSSAEGLKIAKAIQYNLDHAAACTIWSQGVFGLSGGTLESLVQTASSFNFAILVLTPDDVTVKRGVTRNSARDNVLFELGLFVGALGRGRTFMVCSRDEQIDLPSDLAGITPATFSSRPDSDLPGALGAACYEIERAMSNVKNR